MVRKSQYASQQGRRVVKRNDEVTAGLILKCLLSVVLFCAGLITLISLAGCTAVAVDSVPHTVSFDSIVAVSTLLNFLLLVFHV